MILWQSFVYVLISGRHQSQIAGSYGNLTINFCKELRSASTAANDHTSAATTEF